jgi:hypothetical protein
MRHSYVVPMRWMVIYDYEVPGGALNLNSTKLPRPWSPWESSPSRKNPHGRIGNRARDLMISSQKLWPRGWSEIKSYWRQNVCFDFLYSFCMNHFSFWEVSEIWSKMSSGRRVNIRYSCPILVKLDFEVFEKCPSIKFHENPSSGSLIVSCGRTDRHDRTNSRCSQFCERA